MKELLLGVRQQLSPCLLGPRVLQGTSSQVAPGALPSRRCRSSSSFGLPLVGAPGRFGAGRSLPKPTAASWPATHVRASATQPAGPRSGRGIATQPGPCHGVVVWRGAGVVLMGSRAALGPLEPRPHTA